MKDLSNDPSSTSLSYLYPIPKRKVVLSSSLKLNLLGIIWWILNHVHVAEDVKPKKVLVRHLETVTDSETTVDIIHSLFVSELFFFLVESINLCTWLLFYMFWLLLLCVLQESDLDEQSCSKGKFEDRKIAFKKDNVCIVLVMYLHCYSNDSFKFVLFFGSAEKGTALDKSCTSATGNIGCWLWTFSLRFNILGGDLGTLF